MRLEGSKAVRILCERLGVLVLDEMSFEASRPTPLRTILHGFGMLSPGQASHLQYERLISDDRRQPKI